MKARLILTGLALLTMCVTGCSLMPEQQLREINFTVQKLGTPAHVVSEAGKAQVVTVLVEDKAGKMVQGRLDSAGMMLLDAPTYELYLEAWKKQTKTPGVAPVGPVGPVAAGK
jgi:hypothetical protein